MPKPGLSHKKVFGPPFDDPPATQIGEEVFGPVEVRHLDVYGTQLSKRVSVGAGPGGGAQDFTQIFRAAIGLLVGTCVEHLDDVNQIGQILDGFFTEVPSRRVIRMFEIHKAALVLDGQHGFSRRETALNWPPQEQSDELAGGCHDLFASHNPVFAGGLELSRAGYGVMVGKDDRIQSQHATPFSYALRFGLAVKGCRTVNMEIDLDQHGPEVSLSVLPGFAFDGALHAHEREVGSLFDPLSTFGMTAWN
jgi:hypothetical protein